MALAKKDVAPKAAPGGFESDESTVAAQAPKAVDPVAASGVEATKAIVKASSSAVAATAKGALALSGKNALYGDLENEVKVDFGVIPRLVVASGVVKDGDKKVLGNWIEGELVSWNRNYVVSPGDDSDEAKKQVAYSSDGVVIDETKQPVADYLKALLVDYPKANVKEYLEVVMILEDCDKSSEHKGNLVQISLSPSSRKLFEGFRLQESLKVARGKLTADQAKYVRFTTDPKSFGGNDYSVLQPRVAQRPQ
jgi:hypothetical protein